MNQPEIYQKLTNVFHEVFDNDDINLSPKMTSNDLEEWDSLAHVRLIVAVEEAFGVRFAAGEGTVLKDVGHLVATIEQKLSR